MFDSWTLMDYLAWAMGSLRGERDTMETYPLKLSYHVRTYYFGERLIPDLLGKADVPEGTVAETWEISDHRDAPAEVTNGPYAGRTLHELVEEFPDELVGIGWRGPHFPLLGKLLDASHMLPVHLHPDDETARLRHGEPHGKAEAWHILWAAPGATILAGLKEGLGRGELFEAYKAEDYDSVMPRMPIHTGDTVYVPGGIIHSFGPDTLIFEIQQTSDLGQFVMPRDLYGERLSDEEWEKNINATLDELKTDYLPKPNPGLVVEDGPNRRVLCAAGPHFALERWTLREPQAEPAYPRRCAMVTNVGEGPVTVEYAGGTETLGRAESCILPAVIGEVRLVPDATAGANAGANAGVNAEASLVVCYVPDLVEDVVEPLRAAGYSEGEIRALGEVDV